MGKTTTARRVSKTFSAEKVLYQLVNFLYLKIDFLDFGFGSGINTSALLENIMAVSSKVFEQRKGLLVDFFIYCF